ncbi:MAG: hypothetical protein IJU83_01350 [Clostridia bacterium]|nr:hypothetical protein [Clostridia bacterium]
MEEKKVEEVGSETTQPQKNENKEIKVSLSERVINASFAIIALIALAFTKILREFGVGSAAFVGIMSIIVLSLAVIGVLWNFIRCKKPTLEFYFSAGVAFVALLTM